MCVAEGSARSRCAIDIGLEDFFFQGLRNPIGAFPTGDEGPLTLAKQFVNRTGHVLS